MISNAQNKNGTFSADVKLHLHIGDQCFELGQLGPGLAILRDARAIDATEGDIETIVDEKVTRWPVRFTSPITGDSKRFTFEAV
jgi:hypothetical protein